MDPKDILLAWASRYKNCAVNHIPEGAIINPTDVFWRSRHIRFQNGTPDGLLSDRRGYTKENATLFHLERVATYHEVLAEMEYGERIIYNPNLEEVL